MLFQKRLDFAPGKCLKVCLAENVVHPKRALYGDDKRPPHELVEFFNA
jgi:hypothetical protein